MGNQKISARRRLDLFLHSIRFRLAVWFVLILGIVLVFFSAFVYLRQAQEIRSIAVDRLNTRLQILLGTAGGGDHEDRQTPIMLLISGGGTANAWLQEGEALAVLSSQGNLVQSWGALPSEDLQGLPIQGIGAGSVQQIRINTAAVANTDYLFTVLPFQVNNNTAETLLMGTPLDPDRQLSRLLVSLILGNLLMLLIALSGGFLLADRAMRPVRTITQAARQISETDLSKRLQLQGKDELVELANTFDDMLARLQAAFERQRQFTADSSHELRTPLTIIELETSRTLSAKRSIPEYERTLQTIQAENQFMIRLINNLLVLARMDAGQATLQMNSIDLGEVVFEVVERLRPIAVSKGVSIMIDDTPPVSVWGDRQYLMQMFNNLVENGIKYSTGADARVEVSLETVAEGRRSLARVRVSDHGAGIAAEHLPHLFDRFYQVEASRSRPASEENLLKGSSSGTGLGLAIAQWIALAHQGEIKVSSAVGQGTTFEVNIPILDEPSKN
jgi:two-component system OmpR family sensor kinase